MKQMVLILVANSSEAKLFTSEQLGEDLALYKQFQHDGSREKISAIVSDKNGHFQTNNGSGQGSFVEQHNPKEVEAEVFALEMANALNSERLSNKYDQMIVIASPKFHGLLNQKCHKDVRQMVSHDVQKDYTKMPDADLNTHLSSLVGLK